MRVVWFVGGVEGGRGFFVLVGFFGVFIWVRIWDLLWDFEGGEILGDSCYFIKSFLG